MGSAFVICMVGARLLLVAVFLLAACSPPAGMNPSPTGSKVSASPSSPGPPTPTPNDSTPLSLSAIQRLNVRVGYIAGWTGTGLGLAKTSDGGITWQRLPIPADHPP